MSTNSELWKSWSTQVERAASRLGLERLQASPLHELAAIVLADVEQRATGATAASWPRHLAEWRGAVRALPLAGSARGREHRASHSDW